MEELKSGLVKNMQEIIELIQVISQHNYSEIFNTISSKIIIISGLMHSYNEYEMALQQHNYIEAIKFWNYMMAYAEK